MFEFGCLYGVVYRGYVYGRVRYRAFRRRVFVYFLVLSGFVWFVMFDVVSVWCVIGGNFSKYEFGIF